MSAKYGSLEEGTNPNAQGGSAEFQRILQTIQTTITEFNRSTTQLKSLMGLIGTARDSKEKRNELHVLEQRMNKMVDTVKNLFMRLATFTITDKILKLRADNLKSQFQTQLTSYGALQKAILQRVSDTDTRPATSSNPFHDEAMGHGDDSVGHSQQGQLQQQFTQQHAELAHDMEQERQMADLTRDIIDVEGIFRQMNTLVYEQGQQIRNIEDYVDNTEDAVEQGNQQLDAAIRSRNSRRKKCCCLMIFLAVLLAVLIFFLVFYLKK